MRNLAILSAALALTAGAAHAAPISDGSEINVVGSVKNFNAKTVTFEEGLASTLVATGDFASLANCAKCVTMPSTITYNPFTPGQVFTMTVGGLTASFDVESEVSASFGPTFVDITDLGTFNLTGRDPTPGEWVLTGNHVANMFTGSFSSTASADAVPEPTSLMIFGAGMVILGVTYRRRRV